MGLGLTGEESLAPVTLHVSVRSFIENAEVAVRRERREQWDRGTGW